MAKRKSINGNLVVFLLAFLFCRHASAETKPVGFAIPFPDLTFTQALSKNGRAYLGIPQKKSFSFKEIRWLPPPQEIMKSSPPTKVKGITTFLILRMAFLLKAVKASQL
jgi:hypothetical protein